MQGKRRLVPAGRMRHDERHRRVPAVWHSAGPVLPVGDVAQCEHGGTLTEARAIAAAYAPLYFPGTIERERSAAHHDGGGTGARRPGHGAEADQGFAHDRHRDRCRRPADGARHVMVMQSNAAFGIDGWQPQVRPDGTFTVSGLAARHLHAPRAADGTDRVMDLRLRWLPSRSPATTSRTCSSSATKPSTLTGRIIVDPAAASLVAADADDRAFPASSPACRCHLRRRLEWLTTTRSSSSRPRA